MADTASRLAQRITRLPDGLTEEDFAPFLQENPGLTLADGIREYHLRNAEENTTSIGDEIRRAYTDISNPLTEMVGSAIGRVAQVGRFGQGMEETEAGFNPLRPLSERYKSLGTTVAQNIIPQTLTGAALMGAAGPVSRVGAGLSGAGARLLAMAGVGGATEAVTGKGETFPERAATGMAVGAGAQAIGETLRTAGSSLEFWRRHFGTQPNRVRWEATNAQEHLAGLLDDVPPFAAALPGSTVRGRTDAPNLLMRLTQKAPKHRKILAKELLSDSMQSADDMAVMAVGGPHVEIPMMSFNIRKGITASPGAVPMRVPIKEALNELKLVTEEAMAAKAQGASGHVTQALKDQMRQEILTAIERGSPGAARVYEEAIGVYARGMAWTKTMQGSRATTGPVRSSEGPVIDTRRFLDRLIATGRAGDLPLTTKRLTRGEPIGAVETGMQAPRGRMYKAGESITAQIPWIRLQVPGGWPPYPGGTKIPTLSTIIGANAVSGYMD